MSATIQYWSLLKKNFLVQRRQKVTICLEITLPSVLVLVMLIVRQHVKVETDKARLYVPFQPNLIPFTPKIIAFTPDTDWNRQCAETAASLLEACEDLKTYCITRLPVTAVGESIS